jgi:hypothetical protein
VAAAKEEVAVVAAEEVAVAVMMAAAEWQLRVPGQEAEELLPLRSQPEPAEAGAA